VGRVGRAFSTRGGMISNLKEARSRWQKDHPGRSTGSGKRARLNTSVSEKDLGNTDQQWNGDKSKHTKNIRRKRRVKVGKETKEANKQPKR